VENCHSVSGVLGLIPECYCKLRTITSNFIFNYFIRFWNFLRAFFKLALSMPSKISISWFYFKSWMIDLAVLLSGTLIYFSIIIFSSLLTCLSCWFSMISDAYLVCYEKCSRSESGSNVSY